MDFYKNKTKKLGTIHADSIQWYLTRSQYLLRAQHPSFETKSYLEAVRLLHVLHYIPLQFRLRILGPFHLLQFLPLDFARDGLG